MKKKKMETELEKKKQMETELERIKKQIEREQEREDRETYYNPNMDE